jgi:hypothetical protein
VAEEEDAVTAAAGATLAGLGRVGRFRLTV